MDKLEGPPEYPTPVRAEVRQELDMDRRTFVSASSAVPMTSQLAAGQTPDLQDASTAPGSAPTPSIIASPPVVQNPTTDCVSITWQVSSLAAGWIEWGLTEQLGRIAKPAHHGLTQFDDIMLSVQVQGLAGAKSIFYRVATLPLEYIDAYQMARGEVAYGPVRQVRLPDSQTDKISLAVVNDTHEHAITVKALAARINEQNPDLLFWNGDTSNNFHDDKRLAEICLTPGAVTGNMAAGGWASTRPLLFVPGNHDVRGIRAQTLPQALTPWAMSDGDPEELSNVAWRGGRYCFALRHGPVAIIGLDTGEDKPDERDVFAGLAAYEPYRRVQETWLKAVLKQEDIAEAPHLIAFSHIPLRGLPGQNDGQTNDDYARYSGQGQTLWLPHLVKAGCKVIISGHTHRHRTDEPTAEFPICQIVGGGPKPEQATLINIAADAQKLTVTIEDIEQKPLGQWHFTPRV